MSSQPLLVVEAVKPGRFVKRKQRFTAEILGESGERRLCHLHDPGRLRHILRPGARLLYREAWRPGRRTSCDVVAAVTPEGVLALEDTRLPNRLLPEALPRLLPGYTILRPEAWVNGTRVDFAAQAPSGALALIEVKGTNLAKGGVAFFPDAPSRRARRQLEALAAAATEGAEAHIVFTVLRPDARVLRPSRAVDPALARLLCALRERLHYHAYTVEPRLAGDRLEVHMGDVIQVKPCS